MLTSHIVGILKSFFRYPVRVWVGRMAWRDFGSAELLHIEGQFTCELQKVQSGPADSTYGDIGPRRAGTVLGCVDSGPVTHAKELWSAVRGNVRFVSYCGRRDLSPGGFRAFAE
jgi:hypothetical protein